MSEVGVLGAGTMGLGIAQLAALAGRDVTIVDPFADGEAALGRLAVALDKGAARGRWSVDEAGAAHARARFGELADLGSAELVIEAAPEDPQLKRQILADLEGAVGADCAIATNTSSLRVAGLAAALRGPARLVGMHFFNPAPLMPLVEVVAGPDSADWALDRARELGVAMGRRVIDATDEPGFIVNRCNRPFTLEALRLLEEEIADPATIDSCARLGGGFRMGPFELQDLIGLDVSAAVGDAFYDQSDHDPRWRPSSAPTGLVAEGRLGRKSGRGWYAYPDGPPADQTPPEEGSSAGTVTVLGRGPLVARLSGLAEMAGWRLAEDPRETTDLILDLRLRPEPGDGTAPRAVLLAGTTLRPLEGAGAIGLHCLATLADDGLVEICVGPGTSPVSAEALRWFLASCGLRQAEVGDAAGLVSGRIVAQLVNEAHYALEAGVGSAADIDAGMELGVGHPYGPLAWGRAVGLGQVLAILERLAADIEVDRYAPAPSLRAAASTEP